MHNEPATYAEAMQQPDSKKWHAAMGKERDCLNNAGTWEVKKSSVPPGHRIVRGKWVYKRK
jgi:hypothetical protein